MEVSIGNAPTLGSASAKHTIIAYSDFECPYCGVFARDEFPAIKQRFIDTGVIRFAFKNFPLDSHENAMPAAMAASCAGEQNLFWQYHDELFATQKLELADLNTTAQKLGVDMQLFGACLDRKESEMLLQKNEGLHLGVAGTPTFFIDGKKHVGGFSADELAVILASG
jgi:protein-disulfide isomerase